MGVSVKSIVMLNLIIFTVVLFGGFLSSCKDNSDKDLINDSIPQAPWYGWNKYQIKPKDSLVRLGLNLIDSTSYYFGPKGKIAAITNGMDCGNCHMHAGIIPWGNNFSAVVMSYPSFSGRSGKIQTISERINGCFQRSLNGSPLDTTSREMKAIIAYMHWIGDDIPGDRKPLGSGIMKLPYLNRPADTARGKSVFINNCQRCHGKNGEGKLNENASAFIYPPLWGEHSYNTGAGFYRISNVAGFVKNNMPFDEASYQHPKLTDEEAWDVAAFIDSKPRPAFNNNNDYPDVSKKPIDDPFGPYADTFSETQHKYGPFQPIAEVIKKSKN